MTGRIDVWQREKNQPFNELSREEFARARAKGQTVKASSVSAGISYATGMQFERHEGIQARVRELRQGTEAFVGVSKAWILTQLMTNVTEARDNNAYKASNEALALIYKMISEDDDVGAGVIRSMPVNTNPRELQRRLANAFAPPKTSKPVLQEPAAIDAEGEDASEA